MDQDCLGRCCQWCVHKYLCTGSRILCTHWDRHSKCSKTKNNRRRSMFLHSDRWEYTLQKDMFKEPIVFCMLIRHVHIRTYHCPGSRLLSTHWDSHSRHWKMNVGTFLHSDRRDYSLQIGKKMQYFTAKPHLMKFIITKGTVTKDKCKDTVQRTGNGLLSR